MHPFRRPPQALDAVEGHRHAPRFLAANRAAVVASVARSLIALAFVIPLLWVVSSALRPNQEIFEFISPFQWHTLVPHRWTLENFDALRHTPLLRAIGNSLFVASVTVAVGLFLSSTAAFALSALNFRGRGVVFSVIILSFLIPFDSIAIPLATLFRDHGLQNSFVGLILPGIGNGIAIFLLRQFFLGIPVELVDAGRIDGLSWWGIYLRIYIPLSVPALIGAGLTLFLFQWQAYVWPLLIGTDSEHVLGPVALANFQGQYEVNYGVLFAAAALLTLIPLVIILALQRHFIQSVSTSGLK